MAGKRATEFAAKVKELRLALRIPKAEVIGYMAVSSEVPGWMQSKARKIIRKAEGKSQF